jgi:methyl-accepting chemotaxis protein
MSTEAKRVSISTKIFLIAASFAIPICVLLFLTVTNIQSNIDFAKLEEKGVQYQQPLEDLLQNIQNTQIAFNSGNKDQMSEKQRAIDDAFIRLENINNLIGADLQFTDEGLAKRGRDRQRVEYVKKDWERLSSMLAQSADQNEINTKFNQISSDLLTMIVHMGDTSNLILDPDLDSYYLMDATLQALPQTQSRLASMMQYGYQVLKRGTATDDEKVKLAVYSKMLQDNDISRVLNDVKTSINEDKNFYGVSPSLQLNLSAGFKEYEATNNTFIEMTQKVAKGGSGISPESYLNAGLAAREASFKLWNTYIAEQDKLLKIRISYFQNKLVLSLVLAFVAIILAASLAFYLTRTISQPLFKLVKILGPGATLLSVCVERISEASKNQFADPEETRFICEELNANCTSMRESVRELEAQVTGKSS